MSELISKQEVLSEIAFAMVDDIPDVQALYDKIESMEPIQPTLNGNQQIVLEWLKERYKNPIIINPVAVIFSLHDAYVENEHSEVSEAYGELTDKEESQVLQVFSQWAQEQED